jgi:hypothetical protein
MEICYQLHAPIALPRPLLYPLGTWLGGSQILPVYYEEENTLVLTGNRTPAVQPVTVVTEL